MVVTEECGSVCAGHRQLTAYFCGPELLMAVEGVWGGEEGVEQDAGWWCGVVWY